MEAGFLKGLKSSMIWAVTRVRESKERANALIEELQSQDHHDSIGKTESSGSGS